MKLDESEILRYLGYRGKQPDAALHELVLSCAEELKRVATPRSVFRLFPVTFGEDGVQLGNLTVEGQDLRQHIRGCKEAVLFAATLGIQTDILLERYSHIDMSKAAVLQTASAAMIESYCDEVEKKISEQAAGRGFFLRPRYSPGYGDFPIRLQKDILNTLDCPKRIGLSMTESFMLVPTKSVTAVIGLTSDPTGCHIAKCMGCNNGNCPFRKEGNE
jgi:hypothetical protein